MKHSIIVALTIALAFVLFSQEKSEESKSPQSCIHYFEKIKIKGKKPRWFRDESLTIGISRNLLNNKQAKSGYLIITAHGKSYYNMEITLKRGDAVIPKKIKINHVSHNAMLLVIVEKSLAELIASSEGDLTVSRLSATGK